MGSVFHSCAEKLQVNFVIFVFSHKEFKKTLPGNKKKHCNCAKRLNKKACFPTCMILVTAIVHFRYIKIQLEREV